MSSVLSAAETRERLKCMFEQRDRQFNLPCTTPDGQPIAYVVADGGLLCGACACGYNGAELVLSDLDPDCPDDVQWIIIGSQPADNSDTCAHCSKPIDGRLPRSCRCDQCDSAIINGVHCHEHGCPKSRIDLATGEPYA